MTRKASAAIIALRGTGRPDRSLKARGTALLTKVPAPPASLSAAARREWRSCGAAAIGIGTLTAADLRSLELLASVLAEERELRQAIAKEGATITSGTVVKANPNLRQLAQTRASALRLLVAFGLV